MTALVLGLSSSVCWGLADFLGGFQTRRIPALLVVAIGQLGALITLGVVLMATAGSVPAAVWPQAAIAGVGLAGGLAAFYRALAQGSMGVVAPIVACGTVVPVVVSLARGEQPVAAQGAGLALAVLGVVLAARARPDASAGAQRSAGLGLAALAALLLGSSLVFIERASETDVLATLMVSRTAGLATLIAALLLSGTALRAPGRQLPLLLAIGLLDVLATGMFALASTQGLLSVVAVASSLYPAVTVLMARLVLDEQLSRMQLCGIAAVLTGVCLMAAAA